MKRHVSPSFIHKLFICLVFLTCSLGYSSPSFSAEKLNLTTAKFLLSANMTPPGFETSKQVSLPHKHSAHSDVSGWYQIQFNADNTNDKPLAVFLTSLNMNAELFLNGERIGSGGNMTPPIARNWHKPLLFMLPNHLLTNKNNLLQIHIVSSSPGRFIYLESVFIGEESVLQADYSQLHFEKQTIYVISLILSFIIGLLMLYLWYLRRQGEYFWFAISSLIWGTACLDIILTYLPISTYAWQASILWLIGWMPVTLSLFLYQYMQVRINILGKFIFSYGILLFFLLWVSPIDFIFKPILLWFVLTMLMGLHTITLLYKHRKQLLKKNKSMFRLLFGAILICFILAIHDFLFVLEILDLSSRIWLGFAIPLLLIAISILLVQQFAKAMQDIEDINRTLKGQIKEAEQKMKVDYEIIVKLETANAVGIERQRIFGDLHDDLGAKLLSLIYKSETAEQKHLAKEAMEGLREIVSYTPSQLNQHHTPLLTWRQECQKRAMAHQTTLKWHQARITDTYQLPEVVTAQLSMVLREALSNALKHGDGKNIRIRIHLRFEHLFMSVHNHGAMFSETNTSGRGKHNMQHRIQSLGGFIRWKGNQLGGCNVSWAVPINQGA